MEDWSHISRHEIETELIHKDAIEMGIRPYTRNSEDGSIYLVPRGGILGAGNDLGKFPIAKRRYSKPPTMMIGQHEVGSISMPLFWPTTHSCSHLSTWAYELGVEFWEVDGRDGERDWFLTLIDG